MTMNSSASAALVIQSLRPVSSKWSPRSTARQASANASDSLGHLDAHDPQLEALVDERAGDARRLVHLADERTHFRLRELPHHVAKQALVLGQVAQGEAADLGGGVGHGVHLAQCPRLCYPVV